MSVIKLCQEQNDKIYTAARYDDLDTLEEMRSSGVVVTGNLVSVHTRVTHIMYVIITANSNQLCGAY